jgi:hypothetical protein
MRLDIWRAQHRPVYVDLLADICYVDSGVFDGDETARVDEQVDEVLGRVALAVQATVANHELHHTPTFAGLGL